MTLTTEDLRKLDAGGVVISPEAKERIRASDEMAAAAADQKTAQARAARVEVNRTTRARTEALTEALAAAKIYAAAAEAYRAADMADQSARRRARALDVTDVPPRVTAYEELHAMRDDFASISRGL